MTKYPVSKAKIGIIMENTYTGIDEPVAGSAALEGDSYAGALYANNATLTYQVIPVPTDVSIDIQPMEENITTVSDDYEHDIIIRPMGSGSFEVVQWVDDTGSGVMDSRHLLYCGTKFPRGISNTANDGDANYSIFDDTAVTKATDNTGYAIAVENKYTDSGGTVHYVLFTFHNCKIKVTPTIGPQKANRLRVEFSDARYVDGPTVSTSTFATHSDT